MMSHLTLNKETAKISLSQDGFNNLDECIEVKINIFLSAAVTTAPSVTCLIYFQHIWVLHRCYALTLPQQFKTQPLRNSNTLYKCLLVVKTTPKTQKQPNNSVNN